MEHRYNVIRNTREIKARDIYNGKDNIATGCTYSYDGDQEPECLASFETLEDAKAFIAENRLSSGIKELSSSIGKFYSVEEIYIEAGEVDEDGVMECPDVFDIFQLPAVD